MKRGYGFIGGLITSAVLIVFCMVVALVFMGTPAFATNTNEQQTEALVEETNQPEAEKLVYQIVTDNWGILTNDQIANIEAKVGGLTEIDAALYIELVDPQTANQKYANGKSEQMYTEVFGEGYRNGIMIVFSFYEEANCYYAVHYGGNVKLSESKVSNIIEGTYHDFKTDSTWVEGSFIQCTDYFKTLKLATSEGVTEKTEREPVPTSTVVLAILFAISCVGIVVLVIKYVTLRSENNETKKSLEASYRKNRELSDENAELRSGITEARERANTLKKWQANATAVHPKIQSEIDDLIARQAAAMFDKRFEAVMALDPIMENFNSYHSMVSAYEALSDLAKKYVTLNMTVASKNRQIAAEAYAAAATSKIEHVVKNCAGDRHHRSQLNETYSYYNGLPTYVRMMLAAHLIRNLTSKKEEAERSYRRYQSEQHSYHSSTSSHYGGTFGGGIHGGGTFGGHVGGGH